MPLIKLKDTPEAGEFKQVILPIIIAHRFADEFVNLSDEGKNEEISRPDNYIVPNQQSLTKRHISLLRNEVVKYNKKNLNPGEKVKHGTGGANKVRSVYQSVILEDLILCFNRGFEEITNQLLHDTAKSLNYSGKNSIKDFIDHINKFTVCQNYVANAFYFINPFKITLTCELGNSYSSIDEFLRTGLKLKKCLVLLDNARNSTENSSDPELKKINNTTRKDNIQSVKLSDEKTGDFPDSLAYTEYCIGHYLNLDRNPVLAGVILEWRGETLLRVDLFQQDGFRRSLSPHNFTSLENGIIDGGKTIYVVLAQNTSQPKIPAVQMQISIEKNANNSQRNGLYSSIMYKPLAKSAQISGIVVLQTVKEAKKNSELEKIINTITKAWDNTSSSLSLLSPSEIKLLTDGWAIRYRLLGQLVNNVTVTNDAVTTPWARLQRYVGRYVCFYIRLAKSPVRFETSQIEIFPDGSAKLEQSQEGKISMGYIRIDANRIWMYFGFNDQIGQEPIRFMVDDTNPNNEKNPNNEPKLKGIFSSESTIGNRIVSGRMSMAKLPANAEWPDSLSTPEEKIVPDDFIDDDLSFFTGISQIGINLTDGPIWAKIANRLQNYSAFNKLKALCSDFSINNEPFNNCQFYYYNFKTDPADKNQFVIERNLATFLPNGKVIIKASSTKAYEGYAYHLKNTLRLSVSNEESGFLEVFLELNDDAAKLSNIKILYGMSLWHSTSRLQGKMVVLSRYGDRSFSGEAELFRFTADYRDALEAEDIAGGGVISYLRGEINRYMHATTESSPEQFRPRDQSFREIHFLIACYYGFRMQYTWPVADQSSVKPSEDELLKSCKKHLKQAYIHGYACDFSGLKLDPNAVMNNRKLIEQAYENRFLTHVSKNEQKTRLDEDSKTIEILKRIRQIAKEQIFMKEAFKEGGPLDNSEILEYARRYWDF